jgi:hypothetical protein
MLNCTDLACVLHHHHFYAHLHHLKRHLDGHHDHHHEEDGKIFALYFFSRFAIYDKIESSMFVNSTPQFFSPNSLHVH